LACAHVRKSVTARAVKSLQAFNKGIKKGILLIVYPVLLACAWRTNHQPIFSVLSSPQLTYLRLLSEF